MGKLAEHPRTGGRANLGGFEVQTHAQARLCPRPAVRAGHSPRALGGKGGGAFLPPFTAPECPRQLRSSPLRGLARKIGRRLRSRGWEPRKTRGKEEVLPRQEPGRWWSASPGDCGRGGGGTAGRKQKAPLSALVPAIYLGE